MNDFEVTDYIGRSGQTVSLQGKKNYLEENPNQEATFSIITLEEDKLIGTATLGRFIGDKEYLGKVYGTEAIRLLLDYGFNYMNLHSVKLQLLSFNKRAL